MADPTCGCAPLEESVPPQGFVFPSAGPFNSRPRCLGLVLGTIRAYAPGIEKDFICEVSGLETDHVESALRRLERHQMVFPVTESIPWYHRSRKALLWREQPRPELMGRSLPQYRKPSTGPLPDRIPPQLWCMFWSGIDPRFIRLPEHAWYAASRLIAPKGSWRYLPAETWALRHLPIWALRKLLDTRGYADTPVAARIKLRISHSAPPPSPGC